jgi:hypothetical protein
MGGCWQQLAAKRRKFLIHEQATSSGNLNPPRTDTTTMLRGRPTARKLLSPSAMVFVLSHPA